MDVKDLTRAQNDAAGNPVDFIYCRVAPLYAVYRACGRVMVHFADDGLKASNGNPLHTEQRLAISGLAPLRGEIDGLLNPWRDDRAEKRLSKTEQFDRRIADALTIALQGETAQAGLLLGGIKTDVSSERQAAARTLYLGVAALSALLVICMAALLGGRWYNTALYEFSPTTRAIFFGSGMGALGALVSIAFGFKDRKIGTDLQRGNNMADAALRILIGSVSAAVLFAILGGNLVSIKIGSTELIPTCTLAACGNAAKHLVLNQPLAIVIGFVAGFSERMVSELLGRTIISQFEGASERGNPGAQGASGSRPTDKSSGGTAQDETNPLGRNAPNPATAPPPAQAGAAAPSGPPNAAEAQPDADGNDWTDGCCEPGSDFQPEQLTADVELPEATGGIASDGVKPGGTGAQQ